VAGFFVPAVNGGIGNAGGQLAFELPVFVDDFPEGGKVVGLEFCFELFRERDHPLQDALLLPRSRYFGSLVAKDG
jgi:hypothetical protein